MRILLVMLCISTISFSLESAAQEICWSEQWTAPTEGLRERALILGGFDGLRSAMDANRYRPFQTVGEVTLSAALQTLNLSSLMPKASNWPHICDSPYQGKLIIDRVRELGPQHPYIRALAANQIRVLSNCNWPKDDATALPERNWADLLDPTGKVAAMGEHDFAYLTGVALFYDGKFEEARAAFAMVSEDEASSHRDAGRLMEVRSLREMEAVDEAYVLAKRYRIEASNDLKVALDKQEDIIAQYSTSTDYSTAHLEKIYRRLARLQIENEALGFRALQANQDFDLYFMNEFARLSGSGEPDLRHDWWLREEPPEARRAFLAVHNLAKRYDGIDWVQAYHASVAFDRDNTWFAGPDIPIDDPAYDAVTDHAYRNWQNGKLRWAMIVAERLAPDSKYVPEIIKLVDELRNEAASCSLSPAEYAIYARITHHVVRVLASNENYKSAFEVLHARNQNKLYPSFENILNTNNMLVKLLMVRGEYDLIKKHEAFLTGLQRHRYTQQYPLSTRKPGILWTVTSLEGLVETHPEHFMVLVNMISSKNLEALLTPKPGKASIQYENAARVAEVLWMRGFVFGDEAQMARAEPFVLRYHRDLKRYFRHMKAAKTPEARNFARAVMVLRNPGLTPYFDNARPRRRVDISKYNRGNPIEGNWWCDADDRAHVADNEDRIKWRFFSDFYRPNINRRKLDWFRVNRKNYSQQGEQAILDEAWRRFRREYGPFEVISEEEQRKLATLPRASQWLAEKVRAYIESPAGIADRNTRRDERIPESLHRIVSATRFSCHTLERGNAKTSRWAYQILHRYYGNTVWAAETPYWYDTLNNRSVRRHRRP